MSRNEIVTIASRALSVFCLIEALCQITYLPERFISLHHYTQRVSASLAGTQDTFGIYYLDLERVALAFLFMRIAGFMLVALLFWQCGPRISGLLLPLVKNEEPSA